MLVDRLARLWSPKEMTPAIAVQCAEYAFRFDDLAQPRHHRTCRFLFHQPRIVDFARRIVQNHNQVVPTLVPKPAMLAAGIVTLSGGQRMGC